jgi:hypothetical protein
MKTLSKNTFRFLSLASVSLLVAFTFSCKKDKVEPNPPGGSGGSGSGTSQPIVATADLNYVTDGITYDFKCYEQEDYGEIINFGDTLLILRLGTTDKTGKSIDKATMIFQIRNINGFQQGEVYTVADNTDDRSIWLMSTHTIDPNDLPDSYSAANYNNGNPQLGFGELKITSLNGKHIKGTFNLTAEGPAYINPQKQLTIANGKFESYNLVYN